MKESTTRYQPDLQNSGRNSRRKSPGDDAGRVGVFRGREARRQFRLQGNGEGTAVPMGRVQAQVQLQVDEVIGLLEQCFFLGNQKHLHKV